LPLTGVNAHTAKTFDNIHVKYEHVDYIYFVLILAWKVYQKQGDNYTEKCHKLRNCNSGNTCPGETVTYVLLLAPVVWSA